MFANTLKKNFQSQVTNRLAHAKCRYDAKVTNDINLCAKNINFVVHFNCCRLITKLVVLRNGEMDHAVVKHNVDMDWIQLTCWTVYVE